MATSDDLYTTLRVLIVDDAYGIQEVLQGFLEELGATAVHTANGGAEALECLRELNGEVDLVITDVRMPGMDGYELVSRIRLGEVPTCEDVPVLILTGFYSDEDRQQAREHRIQGYVLKPPTIDVLDNEIRHVLGVI